MGITKTALFTDQQNQMALIFKALGHPARIAILEYLLKANACICSTIVEELPLAQPTISQHLKELKNTGLIKGNIEGNSIGYCIDHAAFEYVYKYFSKFIQSDSYQNCSI